MIQIELEKFPMFKSCLEFTQQLIRDESVYVFPGSPCFNFPGLLIFYSKINPLFKDNFLGFFRIVLTVTPQMINESVERIRGFCDRHLSK